MFKTSVRVCWRPWKRCFEAKYQRYTVYVFSVIPRSKAKLVAKMLKAIHSQKNKKAPYEKVKAVVAQLREMKLKEAAKRMEDGVEEINLLRLSL